MGSRYYRPPSPRRYGHPARSSTGTFDPYYDHHLYSNHSSPRSSAERIAAVQHPAPYTYAPGTEPGVKSSKSKYDTYTGRPRRNTHTESDGTVRPPVGSLQPTMAIPIRTHGTHYDRPSSPLAHSWDSRAEPYITHAPSKRDHKRIYSVDDNRSAKLIAEIEPPRHEAAKSTHGSSSRSGPRYHYAKPLIRPADLKDDDYSYTDPASMYRETEPVWRRPRSGSVERHSRPTSLIMEKGPRTSNRELGPPPSTRGFDKINSGIARNGSLRDPPRTSSWDRSGDVGKYPDEYYSNPPRSGSSRHPSTAVHQEHHDRRREPYHDDHDGRGREGDTKRHSASDRYDDREVDTKRHSTSNRYDDREADTKRRGTSDRYEDREVDSKRPGASDRYEDREVVTRGFGIRTGETKPPRDESLDRQPIWSPHETGRARADEYGGGFYPPEDPRASGTRMPEPQIPRERDSARYDERPREKDSHHRDRDLDDRGFATAAAPVAGAAVAFGATEVLKHRERDREPDKIRDSTREDRSERVEAKPRHDDEDRRRRHRRAPSSDDSNDDRPRHYIDRDAAKDSDSRRKDSTRKAEPALDPDEEYRRRILQEQERSLRSARDRDHSDSDRDSDRRRRKDDSDRDLDDSDLERRRRRTSPTSTTTEPAHSRYDDRSGSVLDKDIVQEPDSLSPADSRNMQIVAPPKDPAPQPKGILRKPTEKFPEEPEPIREGVAPHKSALKGKDIPVNARWTKIDRRLVNPEALEEAKERFEERMDCVIVLRVLTKQDIQKLADRTREIREAREEEYERERPHRRHRSRKDEEDRDEQDYDSEEEEYEREKERERPRMIESGR